MNKPCKKREYLIRPDSEELQREAKRVIDGQVHRLTTSGQWAEDDGVSPGIAFTAGVIAYYPDVPCECSSLDYGRDRCVNEIAMNHVSEHYSYGSANGRPVRKYVKKNG